VALILRGAVILHTPKTGGTWVNHAIRASGAPYLYLRSDHLELADLRAVMPDVPVIVSVRHPLHWWQSVWSARRVLGWSGPQLDQAWAYDVPARRYGFREFADWIIDEAPGGCTHLFARFIDEKCRAARTENLADDLLRLLADAGIKADEQAVRAVPPANVSGAGQVRLFTRAQARRIAELESEVIGRFYPGNAVPPRVAGD
jgi:hypothetical protein